MALSITARLGLDGSGFRAGVQKAKGAVSGLKKYVSKEMITAGAMMAGAFAVAQIGVQIQKTIEWGTRIRDLALQFGVTTGFVQQMDYAFKQTGTDVEVAFKSMRKMMLAASILKNELTSAMTAEVKLDAFQKMGITMEQIKQLGPQELFMQIAKNLKDVNFASADLHDALNVVFGKAGSQLLVTFGNDLNAMAERLESLGMVEDATIQRLGMIGDKFEEFKTQNRGVWADITGGISSTFQMAFEFITAGVDVLAERLVSIHSGLGSLGKAAVGVFKGMKNMSFKEVSAAVDDLAEAGGHMKDALFGETDAKIQSGELSTGSGAGDMAFQVANAATLGLGGFGLDIGQKMKAKKEDLDERLKQRKNVQKLNEEVQKFNEIEKERQAIAEELAKLSETETQSRFNGLSPLQQMISLNRTLIDQRTKLAAMPFHSPTEIAAATEGLDKIAAASLRAEMEAENLAHAQAQAALAAAGGGGGRDENAAAAMMHLMDLQTQLQAAHDKMAMLVADVANGILPQEVLEEQNALIEGITQNISEARDEVGAAATGDKSIMLAKQLLELQRQYNAEREKLDGMAMYSDDQIAAAVEGMDSDEAASVIAMYEAKNKEFEEQRQLVEDASAAMSGKRVEIAQNKITELSELDTAEKLLKLQQMLVAERAKLANMPFYSESDIDQATFGMDDDDAANLREEMLAANDARTAQQAAVAEVYGATADAKTEADAEAQAKAEEAAEAERNLVGQAQFSQLARIGGSVGGRNPVLDTAKKQLSETEQMRISLETSTKCLTTLSGVK